MSINKGKEYAGGNKDTPQFEFPNSMQKHQL